ncbi:MAG: hypothetical protein K0S74_1158 [Chlamydiales bacterium]|jgi:ATP-binding cassette subfamily B protein|nr:hypothetical protein [Chlamydiales bacterium]
MRVLNFISHSLYPYRYYVAGIFLATIIIAIDANLRPYLIKALIDTISGETRNNNLFALICLYACSQLAIIGGWTLSDWCIIAFNAKYRCQVVEDFTEQITRHPYRFFQNQLSGNLVAKINDTFTLIPSLILAFIHQFVNFALTLLIASFLLTRVHPLIFCSMVIFIIFYLGNTYLNLGTMSLLVKKFSESKAAIFGHLADYITNILNVKNFANAAHEKACLQEVNQKFIHHSQSFGFFSMKFYTLQGLWISIYNIGILALLLYLHSQQKVSSGDFILVFMLNLRITDKLESLVQEARSFATNWGTVAQALSILNMPLELKDREFPATLEVKQGQITFERVYFKYKEGQPLIENLSLTLNPGQKVGLVGYSGSGKSTFTNLILRLFDVNSGSILIDGEDIRNVTQDSLHQAIGMIPQDPSLFHRSLIDNIRYGRLDATNEEVIEAAKQAHAHEFIVTLPQGYHSLVGERGIKLSGGQRQRIAIARAFLKNAPILILDEATSQLDSITERAIQESLWTLMHGKTTLVIAHRLSTLLHMDRILVFEQGKIVQDGSHNELSQIDGLYKSLWEAQIDGFLPEKLDLLLQT